MFNTQQTETISTFADTHGLTLGVVERFAEGLLSSLPKRANGGRKMSDTSKELLDNLRAIASTFKEGFISADMATRFNADKAYVSNALNTLEKEKIVQRIGKRDKLPGEMGKKSIVWKFV